MSVLVASLLSSQFARFLMAGAANTLLTYLLFLGLLPLFAYPLAYSLTFASGIVLSYFLNVHFVFRKAVSLASFLRFPLVYLLQYLLGLAVLWLLVDLVGIQPALAMLASIAVSIPVTFIASRFVLNR